MSNGQKIKVSDASLAAFWSKVKIAGDDDCWIWQGAKNKPRKKSSYTRGIFCFNSTSVKAHLFSALVAHGPRPDGLETLHSCDNALCVNPKHLSYGLHSENIKQCTSRKRNALIEMTKAKTHCIRGHSFDGKNLYVTPSGVRVCKECSRIRKKLFRSGITKSSDASCWPHGKWL
jgi:hypothetical protein